MLTKSQALRLRYPALIAALVASGLIVVWGASAAPDNPFDDAFITYRYADNLRNGLGLVFNPGEWVLGTTAPLYALLLAALGLTGGSMTLIGLWVSIAAWVAAAWSAVAVFADGDASLGAADSAQRRRWLAAGLVPLLLALHPTLRNSVGMETLLVVALMFGSAAAWLRGWRWAGAVLLGALILTRQDGALWALFLGLEMWRRERRLPWREALVTIGVTLPWLAYAQWRYGAILPNSAGAKIGQNGLMAIENATGGAWRFSAEFSRQFARDDWTLGILLGALLLLGAAQALRDRRTWWLVGWLVAYLAVYTALNVVAFPWYFGPPVAVACLLCAKALTVAVSAVPRAALWVVAALALLLLGRYMVQMVQTPPARYRPIYRTAAAWLAENTAADARVAAIEIGALGYYGNRPIIDTMGLVTPALTERQFGWGETLVYAIAAYEPEYAIALPNTAWDGIINQPWFAQWYTPTVAWDGLTIYQRGPRPPLAASVAPNFPFVLGITLEQMAYTDRLTPGQPLDVRLTLATTQPQNAHRYFDVYLADVQTFERLAPTAIFPFDGGYSTRFWLPGDRFTVPATLRLPPDLTSGVYHLGVGLGDEGVTAGWLRAGSPPDVRPVAGLQPLPLAFAWRDGLTLQTLHLPTEPLMPGQSLTWQVEWTLAARMTRDWRTFYHLVDAQGEIVAQRDQRPVDGRWPLPAWLAGERVVETLSVTLPLDLPAGSYGLRIGWYDDGGRLSAENGADFLLIPDAVTVNR